MANPNAVLLGPGTLYAAPLGTAEPASAAAALAAGYRALGYTAEGNTFSYQVNTEDVDVAEEIDPVKVATVGRVIGFGFTLVEMVYANLALSMNAGANVATPGDFSFEPPAPGNEVRVMLLFDSAAQSRWIGRQCINAGNVEIARQKAPAKAGLPANFRLEKPSGVAPFKVYANAATGLV